MMKSNFKKGCMQILLIVNAGFIAAPTFANSDIDTLTASCSACHGAKGVAPATDWPSLAGQKQGYLLEQLKAFKNGTRTNALMTNQLANKSEDDLVRIAQHYASLPFIKAKSASINKKGENVRASCLSCHGMIGKTVNDTWPNLAGQNQGYLLKQLKDFSDKTRESMIMNVIASELTEQEMKDVAQYYEQVGSEY